MAPSPSVNPLAHRLATLRQRLRFVVTLRGLSWLIVLVVGLVTLAGLLDWWLHLPGVIRALFLTGALAGGGCIAFVYLFQPLQKRDDDLSLALQVESQYPELNDCLASTVQFLHQPAGEGDTVSQTLRQAAIGQALRQTQVCDFNRIVDSHGVRRDCLSMIGVCLAAAALVVWQPEGAATALLRLAHPFGSREWPPQTRLALDPSMRMRIARGEPFELRATLKGVVPERAAVRYWFDGSLPSEQTHAIKRSGDLTSGSLTARLEPIAVQKSFRFQVQANDGITPWIQVSVLPPVALVPLDGKASPQIRLRFPAYTDLPAQNLPPGAGNIEAVLGTHVILRAATDRPIARAWIEHHPDQPAQKLAGSLGLLTARDGVHAAALTGVGQTVWGRFPVGAQPYGPGSVLRADFRPWVSGTYALRLIDADDLASSRLFDVRIFGDPPPAVTLERPSASHDSLLVLPQAVVTLRVTAEDPQYAVRSLWLDYKTSKDEPARSRPLFHHQSLGAGLPGLLSGLTSAPVRMVPLPLHLRLQNLTIGRRLPLSQLKHPDGKPLREGDVIVLQAWADDFDDVTVPKPPGRSHEVELRVVGRPVLEAMLHRAEEQVQQELQRLRELERDAIKKADAAEKQWRNTGKLRLEDVDNLLQAEQIQQQIRGRIGNKDEGLRAEVERIQQALRDNDLPRLGTRERMDAVAQELDRLARENLEQVEPLLTAGRKENELTQEGAKPEKGPRSSLGQAVRHQQEIERTLSELLAQLDPFSSTRQARAETKALLQEQRKLAEETAKLGKEIPKGGQPETAEQKAELEKAAEAQARLAEQAAQLLNKMDRIAAEKQRQANEKSQLAKERLRVQEMKKELAELKRKTEPERAEELLEEARAAAKQAEALEEAAQQLREEAAVLRQASSAGRSADVQKQMQQASKNINDNQLSNAGDRQKETAKALEQMAKALEDRREQDLDKLAKKLKQAEKELEKLVEEQELLKKKVKEAQALADPKEREEALQRLAREQQQLRKKAREMAEQLSRLRAPAAGQALRDAADNEMDQAAQKLERAQDAMEKEDEALERLKDALDDVQDAREQAENELAREKLLKIAEQLKLLKDRHDAQVPETERIHKELLQRKDWDRGLRGSLLRQAEGQKAIGDDAAGLADSKLKDADVFAHILKKSARSMQQAAQRIRDRVSKADERLDGKLDGPAHDAAYEQTLKWQREAGNYLDQLLAALKEEEDRLQRAAAGGGGGGGGGGAGGPEGDGIPELAQLKLLRTLQLDLNKRTEDFARAHPDPKKLTEPDKKELAEIRREQTDISDLLDKLTPRAEPEGGKR